MLGCTAGVIPEIETMPCISPVVASKTYPAGLATNMNQFVPGFAMVVLGFHLWHAFQSAFQTLGWKSNLVRAIGLALSLILAIGFGFLPLYLGASM